MNPHMRNAVRFGVEILAYGFRDYIKSELEMKTTSAEHERIKRLAIDAEFKEV